ncbi:type II toxin-antitoxin system PemK/MazF family toxin [Limosilactobacillus sp. Sa3CUN2]|uniref:Type II toxin-antitoxin system PemK/MazF family toxin n=1 Tax=Limosilactobacillus avistercoris TaxID=2762243 RepID=A0ABR8PD51_9LACO|nr:type II toxin-antitoxin system PemK/MazF family toxin [Limosilactobacillus avistercoris]MBD7895225.1 type II toxin-antitoxin system PemK/MazF family toxin [Limosilactobacillus avistercoris]
MSYHNNNYIPQKQDIIWINFELSVGEEICGRHPAIVMSSSNYSRVTGLVMVMPITHAYNNCLRDFFIPLHTKQVEGFINPLQIFTFSIHKRKAEFSGEVASPQDWARALMIHEEILNS